MILYILVVTSGFSALLGVTTLSERSKRDYSKEYTATKEIQPSKVQSFPTSSPTTDPNPIVDCGPFPNSKITLKLRLSVCNNYTDCGILGGKWIPMVKNECSIKQAEELAKYTVIQESNNQNRTFKIHCSYSNGEYQYDYGDLMWSECTAKSNAYWASKKKTIPTLYFPPINLPTKSSSNSTSKTVDEAACRSQYQAETQGANSLGGSARDAAIEIATQSLNRCLSTGKVEVNTIRHDPSPTTCKDCYFGGRN